MERRDFLKTACTTGTVAALAAGTMAQTSQSANAAEPSDGRTLIEFREYLCQTPEKKKKLIDILDSAMIPALNRQGIKPVGIFETSAELNPGERTYNEANNLKVYLLCQYTSCEQMVGATAKLLADKTYMSDAAEIFSAPMRDPIYDSCESTIMRGFEHCPQIEVPNLEKDRVIQIRFYNSYNIERNAAKIEMFDTGGELELFRKSNMLPVFFGETLAGRMMPNLTYMLSFKNEEERSKAWPQFGSSPEWKELSGNPKYKDTANKIVNIVLKPSPKSQI